MRIPGWKLGMQLLLLHHTSTVRALADDCLFTQPHTQPRGLLVLIRLVYNMARFAKKHRDPIAGEGSHPVFQAFYFRTNTAAPLFGMYGPTGLADNFVANVNVGSTDQLFQCYQDRLVARSANLFEPRS